MSAPKLLHIFISHKSKDKTAAIKFKRLLELNCRQISFFLSSDAKSLRGGTSWRETIVKNLDRAAYFILIYTTPADNWDWCLYESGYFAARRGEDSANLIVLHPPGVVPPTPLRRWQSLVAEPGALSDFFNGVFHPGDPRCHFKPGRGTRELKELAQACANAIAPLKSEEYRPNTCFTVVVPGIPDGKTPNLAKIPKNTYVRLDDRAAPVLGLQPSEHFPWSDFEVKALSFNFDIPSLARIIGEARSHSDVSPKLDSFRSPKDNSGFSPHVYSISLQGDGAVEVRLMLLQLPPQLSPESLNAFEQIHSVIGLARRFRREVSERHVADLSKIDNDASNKTRLQFLTALLFSISQVQTIAEREGLTNREKLLDAFNPKQVPIMKELTRKWDLAFAELKRMVASRRACARPGDIFNPLRAINLSFLRVASERLQELALEIRPPDMEGLGIPHCEWIPDMFRCNELSTSTMMQRETPIETSISV